MDPAARPEPAAEPASSAAQPQAEAQPAPAAQAPAPTPLADAYREVAAQIMAAALADRGAYDKLAFLTDRIGARLSGSAALERAVDWAVEVLTKEGHENVRKHKVMVPHWVRGNESAEILAPLAQPLHILGLGNSVGTGPKGITAEVVVADSFEHLESLGKSAVAGKIVLFNKKMPPYRKETGSGYGDVVAYRSSGASRAAALGARAVLVRSVTAHSLRTPHTGSLRYDPPTLQIPGAAVTTEEADLIARLASAGETVRVRLTMGARMLPDKASANVIAELRGRERPDEIVLIGAHSDSWDVGQGAHDDGAGCVIMMQALTVLRRLGLEPRRTIRLVLFTNEENGLRGAIGYAKDHAAEVPNHVMALEADSGGFAPRGFGVQGNELAIAQLRDLVTLLAPLGTMEIQPGHAGADLIPLVAAGVPGIGVWTQGDTYFDIHHTHADTLDKVDPTALAQNVAAVAILAYAIADMPERFGGEPQAAPAQGAAPQTVPAPAGTAPGTAPPVAPRTAPGSGH